MSWFSDQWTKLTGQREDDPSMPIRRVEVVWGRERLLIHVNEQKPGQATLRQLKEEVSRETSVPYEQVKLIIGGLILKDDKAPLAAYNVRNGSRLTLVGTSGGVPLRGDMPGAKRGTSSGVGAQAPGNGAAYVPRQNRNPEQDDEKNLLRRVEEALGHVRKDLVPAVLQFEQTAKSGPADAGSFAPTTLPPQDPSRPASDIATQQHEKLAKEHRKLSELLLRVLLTLDGINVNSDATRKSRKEAVREVQDYLDRVDATWTVLKSKHEAQPTALR